MAYNMCSINTHWIDKHRDLGHKSKLVWQINCIQRILEMAITEKVKYLIMLVIGPMSLSSEFFLPYDSWAIDISTHSPSISRILSLGIFLRDIIEQDGDNRTRSMIFPSIMQNHSLEWRWLQNQWMWTVSNVLSILICVSLSICIYKHVLKL